MAAAELFANTPVTTVTSGGTDAPVSGTVETWTVASAAEFPAAATGVTQFHVGDPAATSEMIAVTNVSGTTWTVTRGAEGSTPVTHSAGFTIQQVGTAGVLGSFAQTGFGDLGGSGTAPTVVSTHLGTALAINQGGTGAGTQQGAINSLTGSQGAGKYLRSDGTNASLTVILAADVPQLNQSTTGTAAAAGNVTGTVAIINGGTGQGTQQGAINSLAGAVTVSTYLRGNGTNVSMTAIVAGDVPVLNQNTSGTASNITATLDQVPTPAANVSLNSHKITSLANGTATTDAAAFGQLPSAGSPLPLTEGGTGVGVASNAALLGSLGAAALAGAAFTGAVTVTEGSGAGAVWVVKNNTTAPTAPTAQVAATTAGDLASGIKVSGETNFRMLTDSNGKHQWGAGGTSTVDTNLYRSGQGTLTTDTNLNVGGTLTAGSPLGIGSGGTGGITAAAAYNNISPMSLTGDTEYESGANTAARLPGNTTTQKEFLSSTGNGTVSAAPAWSVVPGQYLCAPSIYAPGTVTALAVNSATLGAFSSANATTGTFSAPPSGTVMVSASFALQPPSTTVFAFGLAAHGQVSPVVGYTITGEVSSANVQSPTTLMFLVGSLTAASPYSFDLLGASATGTITIKALGASGTAPTGTFGGPLVMTVQAV